jgi:hypothetical protein
MFYFKIKIAVHHHHFVSASWSRALSLLVHIDLKFVIKFAISAFYNILCVKQCIIALRNYSLGDKKYDFERKRCYWLLELNFGEGN